MKSLDDRLADPGLTFDDVLLVPQHSEVKSRKDPDLTTTVAGLEYSVPIIASPMNTVTEEDMLVTMAQLGGLGVLHRYMSLEDQLAILDRVSIRLRSAGHPDPFTSVYVAVGVNDVERVYCLRNAGLHNYCIDVANGHNDNCAKAIRSIKRTDPDARIMAGNVCTYKGALKLAQAGASSIRVGIGPGSLCSTRQVTGHGMPQLTAISECAKIKKERWGDNPNGVSVLKDPGQPEVSIIADGGIKNSGDIVKSLAAGADAVMLGGLLAGTKETPGEVIEESGQLYKYYHGMASNEGRDGWFDRSKTGPAEGVSTKLPYTGKLATKVIQNLSASVQVGLSYSGANNLRELRQKAKWVRVTQAGWVEGTPHGKK